MVGKPKNADIATLKAKRIKTVLQTGQRYQE